MALHFAVQSYALDRWLTPGRPYGDVLKSYSESSLMNSVAKLQHHLGFVGDVYRLPGALALALLAGILTLAVIRAARW